MKAQRRPTSHPRAGAMAQTRQPSGSSPPPHPRRTSDLGSLTTTHDDTAASMCFDLECPLCACKPAQLEVGIIMDFLLHQTYVNMTATRPVTTPNLHLRRLAQSAPTTTTRHTKTGVCATPHKKKKPRRAPKRHNRGQGSIATTRATCDVRAELRLVHRAWRGRDSPAPQEHDGGLGSLFFCRPSSARTAPFCVAITTATFSESRLFHACFFRVMLRVRAETGGLRGVRGRQANGHDARRDA